MDWITENDVMSRLEKAAERLVSRVVLIEECGSTQDVAKELAVREAPEGTVVIARRMVAGRGRAGRRWEAPEGGLWFTIVLRPEGIEGVQILSLLGGVAVARALRKLLGVVPYLKWPNDVLVDGKKVAGILAEGAFLGSRVNYVLLGVGINVNNPLPAELKSIAITLKEVVGSELPIADVLAHVLSEIGELYALLRAGRKDLILDSWREMSCTLGKAVRVVLPDNRSITGVAKDVDIDGNLIVDTGCGIVRVDAGDVIHLLGAGGSAGHVNRNTR